MELCSSEIHHVLSSFMFLFLGLRPGLVNGPLHLIISLRVNLLQHIHEALAGVCVVIHSRFTDEREGRQGCLCARLRP